MKSEVQTFWTDSISQETILSNSMHEFIQKYQQYSVQIQFDDLIRS